MSAPILCCISNRPPPLHFPGPPPEKPRRLGPDMADAGSSRRISTIGTSIIVAGAWARPTWANILRCREVRARFRKKQRPASTDFAPPSFRHVATKPSARCSISLTRRARRRRRRCTRSFFEEHSLASCKRLRKYFQVARTRLPGETPELSCIGRPF